ncbi:right-handed parallel beta-helix repeat-containing protein [Chryseobacterium antibioticum]|uniref:Right-handed parallel beta-helix repeat-containing protein n=1 Tax=Chryseobacterium pyrolae TaxID=2987481 RepID=A0ABT2IIY3_9FLAO|nr:right-handed parallel beta-helix repeat-containing protein [Chryseobacterium pyrolae]MCT2408604.1 right-handed parallel beta-helix repeat-containing protein [Chryseobacterium pyrolae]
MPAIKNSMNELRNLSSAEISSLINSVAAGKPEYVELLGYHPGIPYDQPVIYYLSETTDQDDGFSIITLINNSQYKLELSFGDTVDLTRCGIKGDGLGDETAAINKALVRLYQMKVKTVTIAGINKIDVDSGNKIQLQSNTNYFLNGTVEAMPGKTNGYELVSFAQTVNTKLTGGKIKGNKYSFKAPDGSYYKMWRAYQPYQVGEYVYVNNCPLKVINAGISGGEKPGVSFYIKCEAVTPKPVPYNCNPSYNENTQMTVVDGSVTYEVVHNTDLGEWGFGIFASNTNDFHIENVEISECWGDGIYVRNSYNGTIENVICDDNRRQGMSIIHCDGINILNSQFNKTSGTIPEAGIDIEPNEDQSVRNVNIVNCTCDQNEGYGVLITTPGSKSSVRDVNILNLTTRNNIGDGFACKTEGDSYSHTIFNINVHNLMSSGNHASQIFIEGTNGVKIRNGRVENAFDYPLVDLYKVHNVKISDLEMVGNGNGIRIRKTADNIKIEGNYIETIKTCIVDDHTENKKVNVTIKANALKSVQQTGMDLLGHSSLNIEQNTISRTGTDGIKIGNINRATIINNKTSNIGLANNTYEYGHIVIYGEASEIICENNILENYPDLVTLPVGIIAQSPQMNYCTFRTLHSYYNNSNFGPDQILSNPTVIIQDIR